METKPQGQLRTVNDILDRYQRDRLPNLSERTRRDYTRHIPILRRSFGDRMAAEITRADIARFLDVHTGRIQRNRILAVLSAAFTEAIEWQWLESNVCIGAPRHVSKSRPRFVMPDEFDGFKRIAPKAIWQAMELARYTGQPQANVLGLRWAQVDSRRGLISFRNPKTKRSDEVLVDARIRSVLADCKQCDGRKVYVIANREGTRYTSEGFRSMWQRYMEEWVSADHHRFTFHDIRWTWLAQQRKVDHRITFTPTVFQVPEVKEERDLVAVMMPFRSDFDPVYAAMKRACDDCGLRSLRASDIWEETAIIQDIFNLIFRANVVVVDFSGRNPNVMYETGIAHTLGKTVVPITQSIDDVPFDIQHHRVLLYLSNREGLETLRSKLAGRLGFIAGQANLREI